MKLQLDSPTGQNVFTGYGRGYVKVNGQRYERSLVVTPERIIENWPASRFEHLAASHFEFLLALKPEIVLLGTGATLRFPSPALSRCLATARVGLEVMDTNAACRTYNILAAEGRNVAIAILFG